MSAAAHRTAAALLAAAFAIGSVPCAAEEVPGPWVELQRRGRVELTAEAGASVAPDSVLAWPLGARLAWAFHDRWDVAIEGIVYEHDSIAPSWGPPGTAPEQQPDGAVLLSCAFVLLRDPSVPHSPALALALGVGAVWTQPVTVVDPVRRFHPMAKAAATLALELRVPLAADFRLDIRLRDLVYNELLESPTEPANTWWQANPATWLGPTGTTNRVELLAGFTFGR